MSYLYGFFVIFHIVLHTIILFIDEPKENHGFQVLVLAGLAIIVYALEKIINKMDE